MKKVLTKNEFEKLVGSRIFSVEFLKQDGSVRKAVGRLGVKRYVKGTGRKLSKEVADRLIIYYDFQKKPIVHSTRIMSCKLNAVKNTPFNLPNI